MKAMIYAAGLGTRLMPMTSQKPKALIEVSGQPMLGLLIQRLKNEGITQIIINLHHHPQQIIDFLVRHHYFDIEIALSDESSELLETGGGLLKARWFLDGDEPFLVHNVDVLADISLAKMMAFHQQHRPTATLAVRKRPSSRYLLFDGNNRLWGWKNEKTGERILVDPQLHHLNELAFSGIHLVEPKIFEYLDKPGPFRIIDTYLELAKTHPILGFEHHEGYFVDMGSQEGLRLAAQYLNRTY